MKKAYRVKSEKDFQKAFLQGKSFANRQFVLYVYPKDEQVHFRVGFSVGKKMGNAVQRNRMKRYLRQAVHEISPMLKMPYDYLIIARLGAKKLSYAQVKRSLTHVMNIAGIIQQETE